MYGEQVLKRKEKKRSVKQKRRISQLKRKIQILKELIAIRSKSGLDPGQDLEGKVQVSHPNIPIKLIEQ